ncbi:uncharacterized protein TRUGW13939_08847 [Talaromyces rugulosus]|uniref:F-box domain-containing protein n=1 Tax=Talaromyces rugulosus TaxID=121627 RepID=A0A7H8R5P0_TALRU|nr:uncharacterized protein TRUGW13939_08847 [Talaromyces rugulosus]QKX61692.1 hypothetical protein TRUGW13939_08847 [Talaromyces rugulosus]
MGELLRMPKEIWLIVTDSLESEDLVRLSLTCRRVQTIAEERLYRQCNLEQVISWAWETWIRNKTFEKLVHYRKGPGRREWIFRDIPVLMSAALQVKRDAVNLLLKNDFVVTKEAISFLLSQGRQQDIISTLINGALYGYDALVKMMVKCISGLESAEVDKYGVKKVGALDIFQAASLDRPEITKSISLILPRRMRQSQLYTALVFGINTGMLDDGQKVKAVKSLLAHGAKPVDGRHEKPLELAVRWGYDEIVSILFQGRKFNSRSESHRKAWRIAKRRGHNNILKTLLPEHRVSTRQLSSQLT